jgi:hypothetical protein
MALQLEGFSTPEKSYSQLYQLGEANERRQYRQSQLDEQRRAKRSANATMLNNLLDPKEHLSGSLYDPEISKSLQDMLAEGAKLADEGADGNMILMALGPKVAKVSEYAQKAKLLKKQETEFSEFIKPIKGVDRTKAIEAFKDKAFFTTDANGKKVMKDISEIDPNKVYGDEVLRDGDVFNNEGLSNFVKTAGKETRKGDYKYYNKMGSLTQSKGDFTAPPFMQVETDERGAFKEFVPQYDIVTEDGIPKELEFHTKDGKQTAPVRMVTDGVFNSLPPEAKGYLRQEARKYAKENNVELSSPQAYNFAKAIAYDELKESGKLSSFVSETPEYTKPSAQEIRINLTGSPYAPRAARGSGSGGEGSGDSGNAFDGMGDATFKNFKVKDGAFYNNDGSPKNGKVFITGDRLPSAVKSALKAGGIDPTYLIKGVEAEIVDGKIASISNKLIGTVSRGDMQNVYQPKMDTERKGENLNFGNNGKAKPTDKPKSGIKWK